MALLPYCGSRREHAPGNSVPAYGIDTGSDQAAWTYDFNSLGFRGEEYDPQADFRVHLFGCSHSFGTGLPLEATWGAQLTRQLARDLNRKRPNCLNFAQGGASNDYIVRTAFDQVAGLKPDLAVVQFTFLARTEYVGPGVIRDFNPHNADSSPEFRALLDWYTDEMAVISLLKGALALQSWFRLEKIPYLFLSVRTTRKTIEDCRACPIVERLYAHLDPRPFCPFFFPDLDRARDGEHFGPRSHLALATEIAGHYRSLYG